MESALHLESLVTDTGALVAAARRGGLDAIIPACPGWSMADLVWHTGLAVHAGIGVVRAIATGQPPDPDAQPGSPPDEELIGRLEAGAAELVSTLRELDPDDTMGAPLTDRGYPGPSLYRHFAREVGVHRWDAEDACGTPAPLNDDLATDWLDGVLVTWLPNAARHRNQAVGPWAGESLHFHRTDGDGEWTVTLAGGGAVTATRAHAEADVVVSGRGSALLLLAMNRISPAHPDLEVQGKRDLLDRWTTDVRYGRPAGGPHWVGSPRPRSRSGSEPDQGGRTTPVPE